ncbi:hypothetical protein HQ533_05150 [Candidatus Woesearchaeota archaeon]|nr:hypothetical protein [Candidatus Woesearchaeota archaeon]
MNKHKHETGVLVIVLVLVFIGLLFLLTDELSVTGHSIASESTQYYCGGGIYEGKGFCPDEECINLKLIECFDNGGLSFGWSHS